MRRLCRLRSKKLLRAQQQEAAHHECPSAVAGACVVVGEAGHQRARSPWLRRVTLQAAVGVVAAFVAAAMQAYEIRLFAIKE